MIFVAAKRRFTLLSRASHTPANTMQPQQKEGTVGYIENEVLWRQGITAVQCSGQPRQSLNSSQSAGDDGMVDFSIRMKNRLRFSTCDAPHIPTSKTHEETLLVELRGDLLTITALGADGSPGSGIYAQRAIDLPEASIFTILPELPSHVRDGSFFSALGTVAIFQPRPGKQRRLRAVGTDKNSGQCHGWIFDAIEEASS
jgi:hypothetical protein